jgi:hypothetical protein
MEADVGEENVTVQGIYFVRHLARNHVWFVLELNYGDGTDDVYITELSCN